MQATDEKTVREMALENPASIAIFEALGVDYCCGGGKALSEACAKAGVTTDRVFELLAEAGRAAEPVEATVWSNAPLSQLIAHIVDTHHAFVVREIPRLTAMAAKISSKHASAHPETLEIDRLFQTIGQELTAHLYKEEHILFPMIRKMEQAAFFGSVGGPISVMIAEHDDAGDLFRQIRQASGNYTAPEGVCPTFLGLYHGLEAFERDLHQHIHLENNILFPRALALEQGR